MPPPPAPSLSIGGSCRSPNGLTTSPPRRLSLSGGPYKKIPPAARMDTPTMVLLPCPAWLGRSVVVGRINLELVRASFFHCSLSVCVSETGTSFVRPRRLSMETNSELERTLAQELLGIGRRADRFMGEEEAEREVRQSTSAHTRTCTAPAMRTIRENCSLSPSVAAFYS